MSFCRRPCDLWEPLELRRLLANYVVAPAGNDAGPGTAASPWATLQHAALDVVAGDTINVRAGNYAGFVMGWDIQNSGTAAAPIVWNADPGVNIISRNNKTPDGIDIENCNYIVLDGFSLQPGIDEEAWRSGIRFGGESTGNVARRNIITARSIDKYGIFSSFSTDLLIDGNTVSGTYNSGIYTSNSPIRPTVSNNTVFDAGANGIHFNGDAFQGGTGVVSRAIVENNIVYGCGLLGGSAINMDGIQNSRIQNNLLFNNHAKGITLYQIDASAPSIDNVLVNNTVIMASGSQYCLTIKNSSIRNTILNNIFQNSDAASGAINIDDESRVGLVSDYNAVSSGFTLTDGSTSITLSEWRAVTGQDLTSFIATPATLFVDASISNFHLKPGSLAIDAGTSTLVPPQDLEHNSRPAGAGYDIGAFEFGAIGTPGVPKAPSNLIGSASTSTKLQLSWGDKAINESGFRIERSTAGVPFLPIASLNPNTTTFLDTGLIPNTTYSYRVFALNSAGNSEASNVAAATTFFVTAPSGLAALPASYSSIALTWSDADPQYASSYNVYRGLSRTIPIDLAHRVGSSSIMGFLDTTVTPGVRYYYKITAVSATAIESTASNSEGTRTIPAAPLQVTASVTAASRIDVEWNVSEWWEVDHFNVYRSTSPVFGSAIPFARTEAGTITDNSISAGTTYYYYVTEVNVAGVESARSNVALASITPAAPTALAAAASGSSIGVNWSYDLRATIDHYNLYRSDVPNVLLDAAHKVAAVAQTSFVDTTADNVRMWYYKVTAVNEAGIESASSNVAAAQLPLAFAVLDGAGNLQITGTAGNDLISLAAIGGNINATLNGVTVSYPTTVVQRIIVNGLAGDDALHLDDLGAIATDFRGGTGDNTVDVAAGTLVLVTDIGSAQSRVGITVASGAALRLQASQHLASLQVMANADVIMAAPLGSYLFTQALSISPAGTLDLEESDLILDYSGTSPFADVRSYVLTGYGWPLPRGGISSSSIEAQGGNTILAVMDNAALALTNWDGQTIDATTIIGKYTYFGDANMDGMVSDLDLFLVGQNLFSKGDAFWQGDLNFDGFVTPQDFTSVDAHFGQALANAGTMVQTGMLATITATARNSLAAQSLAPGETTFFTPMPALMPRMMRPGNNADPRREDNDLDAILA